MALEEQGKWVAYQTKYYRCGISIGIELHMDTLTASKALGDDSTTVAVPCNWQTVLLVTAVDI